MKQNSLSLSFTPHSHTHTLFLSHTFSAIFLYPAINVYMCIWSKMRIHILIALTADKAHLLGPCNRTISTVVFSSLLHSIPSRGFWYSETHTHTHTHTHTYTHSNTYTHTLTHTQKKPHPPPLLLDIAGIRGSIRMLIIPVSSLNLSALYLATLICHPRKS